MQQVCRAPIWDGHCVQAGRFLGENLLLLLLVIVPGACALALILRLLANREKRSKIALLAGTSLVSEGVAPARPPTVLCSSRATR
jgi:hypothetical protein